ncbi:hypothetical protein MVEN_02368200 [Mycena venus]|uniref:F-box domain-containing protein n=1 Tax=Mycena venus TaxID=2733690 RepID=A0A8H7CDT6_9AGAR|nr:hypothetical protein MVEN_02368200 [Mycena venus]
MSLNGQGMNTESMETRGAALRVPTEIWLEIFSDSNFLILGSEKDGVPRSLLLFSRVQIDIAPKTLPPAYRTWPETLRALSQTCRKFRTIFLPLFWKHVEACITSGNGTAWAARVATVLLDRCKGLMKRENQHLALHVRIFSVSLSSHLIATVIPLFAQCLELLPNLDTLHILYVERKREEMVTAAFKNVQIPTVQTIILPSYAHAILRACPLVRDVSCNGEDGDELFKTLIDHCPHVERIQGFELTPARAEELSENLPKLREVAVLPYMDFSYLSTIKSLSMIELVVKRWEDVDETELDIEDFSPSTAFKRKLLQLKQKRIDAARAVLRMSTNNVPKGVKMSYWEDITGMAGTTEYTYGCWVRAEEFDV